MKIASYERVALPFVIRETNKELGVYASRFIYKGEKILTFEGTLISFDDAVSKGKETGDPLQVADNLYLDVKQPGKSVNHSCEPTCGLVNGKHLVAIQNIEEGKELTFDYSTTMNEDYWEMKCKCQQPNCRKIIRDFKFLPQEKQERYLTLGVVPQFIIDSLKV